MVAFQELLYSDLKSLSVHCRKSYKLPGGAVFAGISGNLFIYVLWEHNVVKLIFCDMWYWMNHWLIEYIEGSSDLPQYKDLLYSFSLPGSMVFHYTFYLWTIAEKKKP